MAQINEIQKFRHRGFEPNDGSPVLMMMGNDPDPLNTDGTPMKKLWDHLVQQVITVADFIEANPENKTPVETPFGPM